MTIILLIILSIIFLVKLSDMKAEIGAQKRLIFTLREQINDLEKKVAKIVNDLEMQNPKTKVRHETEALDTEEPPPAATAPNKSLLDQPLVIIDNTKKPPKARKQLIDFSTIKTTKKKPLFEFKNENWMGVNLLNRLGALLIVIAAIATTAFEEIPSPIRSVILFASATSVIILGEMMNRKKPTTASMGVTASGVALMYVAIAASYFVLETLGMYPSLIACVLATALGIYLAIRYDEQVVVCFALVGGYLPILALDPFNDALTVGLVIYFVILSVYTLSLALSKKWVISNFIGLFLTIAGTLYLGSQAAPLIALLYACFAFLAYTALPLLSAYKTAYKMAHKTAKIFTELDVIFILINAFVSSIIVFLIATRLNEPYIHAYLSFTFAIIYFALAQFIKHVFQHQNMETIFVLKSIAFIILFVPFTFDQHWFVVAWLLEAVVLTSYGILRKLRFAEYTGLGILGIAILAFLTNSVTLGTQFTFDYTFFSVGLLVILGLYINEKRHQSGYEQVFKWCSLINFWIFLVYILLRYINDLFGNGYTVALIVIVTLVLTWIYVKLKALTDNGMNIIANLMHFASVVMLWSSNFSYVTTWHPGRNLQFDLPVFLLNTVLTLLSLTMVLYYKETVKNNRWITGYKNIILINVWLTILWIVEVLVQDLNLINVDYVWIVHAIATLIIAVVYIKVKLLVDKGLRIIVNFLHAISLFILWISNIELSFWNRYVHHGGSINYGGLVVNLIITLIAFALVIWYKMLIKNKWVAIYKNINLVNIWLFTLYVLGIMMEGLVGNQLVLIIITLIMAFPIARIPIIADKGAKAISIVMQVIGLLWLTVFNLFIYESMFALLLMNAVAQIIALVSLNELAKFLKNNRDETSFKFLILSGYVLLVVTQGVMVQGQVAFTSAIISVLFGVTALAWIMLGFYLKNQPVRKFGLILAIASAAKALVVDTWGLSVPMRIGSYVTLGVVLFIISFIYQKFSTPYDD